MIEVADIFNEYGKSFRDKYKQPLNTLKVMSAIENCRTATLGGHVDECDECGHIKVSYNSCRNRHCPKCQTMKKEKWLEERNKDLLPIPYYHVVFTVPSELKELMLRNKKEMYSLLFKSSSETLMELSKDKKYLGAKIGFIGILHTWGQNIIDHPHIHYIVTGGGLSLDEKEWVTSKKDFFLPVEVISTLFRGKFMYYLMNAYQENRLEFHGSISHLTEQKEMKKFKFELYEKKWVVYCKKPFKNAKYVLKYLGRYTHKVAISNNRILKMENHKITFRWRDYKDHNKNKIMTIGAWEFIRRFLLHVLPNGFVRIRHYGILSNRNRKKKVEKSKELLGVLIKTLQLKEQEVIELDYKVCTCCGEGNMIRKEEIYPRCSSPPKEERSVA